jgi:hypothetical protein
LGKGEAVKEALVKVVMDPAKARSMALAEGFELAKVTLLSHCCTLLLLCCYKAATLLLVQFCHPVDVVPLLLHCYYNVVTMLLRCWYTNVTALLHYPRNERKLAPDVLYPCDIAIK